MVRGTVTEIGATQSVTTRHGERSLATLTLSTQTEGDVQLALWGDWAETAAILTPGMEVLATNLTTQSYEGTKEYATTGESFVVVEPEFLVDVTDIREWVQCPRQYYLSKLDSAETSRPLLVGTIVHEVFGDLLSGRDMAVAVEDRVAAAALDIGLLDANREEIIATVTDHAEAIKQWLAQQTLTGEDMWQNEQLLLSKQFGMKGRADAIRRGMPVELKTGKNTRQDPRFHDKIQAACYALMLQEHRSMPETGILLYTKNATLSRHDTTGDLSPAKEFSLSHGLLAFALRARNQLAAMEHDISIPTGHEADADCDRCFVQDTCRVVAGRLEQESKAGAIGTALPEAERAYFRTCYRAIEHERRAIHQEYRKLWEQSPEERVADDRALIDLSVHDRQSRADGRWELKLDRERGSPSKLRTGDLVLASDGDPLGETTTFGRITDIASDSLTLLVDEPLDITRLDQYPSEATADRMLTALHDAILAGDPRRRAVLMERTAPSFDTVSETFVSNNDAQNRAIQRAVGAEDCALIHGPPGTGKTYTIARLIRALVARGNQVLLSAFTNRAVDNAVAALREQGFEDILRIGSVNGVQDDMQDLMVPTDADPQTQAGRLDEASVIAATAASCGSRTLREQTVDMAVVDEASQLTEPETLAPITRADRFVLVGDHQQLPPVVRTETTVDAPADSPFDGDLSTSLFERLIDAYPDAAVRLDKQYRMAQRIQSFSSQTFYDGALRPATGAVAKRSPEDLVDHPEPPLTDRVSFIDVAGDDQQRMDREEATRIGDLVEGWITAGIPPASIGVIAPYRAQVTLIDQHVPAGVAVDTVDRFQGSSKDLIVISFVASGSLDGPIFEDHRRINVALTRAKRGLVLVGDRSALRTDPFYRRVLSWATA